MVIFSLVILSIKPQKENKKTNMGKEILKQSQQNGLNSSSGYMKLD